ncbi:Protein O-mannosyltransferase 2 [Phlyctochytrium bullatum]|nr:Protein O-mannosyltransferase 2 [Phlyctochytrium bullatum]
MEKEGLRQRKAPEKNKPVDPPTPTGDVKDDSQMKHTPKVAVDGRSKIVYPTFLLLAFTAVSLWTRLYKISWSDFVVWDEAHFGQGFASYYINQTFYFDVHPPLGKMLLGLSGAFVGYNGSFQFESGQKYPEHVNYTGMRVFSALFGAFIVPIAYATGIELRFSAPASIFMTAMVLLDLALLNISRFILLDSMLIFFTCTSAYCLVSFRNRQLEGHFTPQWYTCVKWVGLFTIALVGLHTIEDLWDLLGDIKMSWTNYLKHWFFRIVFLIALPIAIYILSFYLHFAILYRSGDGDAQMSSLFQAGLAGNNFYLNPIDVAFGSKVSLKNGGHGGGLLHSHVQTYPSGSEQQQITCYHHKDSNNDWIIQRPWDYAGETEGTVDFVKNGDVIRLVHEQTTRNLHSHAAYKAPVTTRDYEVTCYGNASIGDANDHWRVEIVNDLKGTTDHIKSLTTRFRLRHVVTGCLLRSGGATLPQWGFKQAEVSCQVNGQNDSSHNIWNVEQHWNDKLPPGGPNAFKSSFLKDFVDLNVAMWTSNNALTPDPDKEPDQLTSQPYEWPFLLKGLRMCGWGDNEIKFYLLGHPLIWWGSAGSFIVFAFIVFFHAVRYQRKIRDWKQTEWEDFFFAAKIGGLGWFLHYFPFWIMGRVTYLHHYFPSLYFGIIMLTVVTDHLTKPFPKILQKIIFGLLTLALVATFFYFSDFAFGFTGPASAYSGRRWLQSWNIHD